MRLANVTTAHDNIRHAAAFSVSNHNAVRVQEDGRMCRRTVWSNLNNTAKNNVVYSLLVSAAGWTMHVPGEVC